MSKPYLETDPLFYNKLIEVANNVGLQPEDLLVVMALESGINPTVHNKNYGGLTQMSKNTLNGLGYNGEVSDFSNEPGYKQLEYIETHIKKLASIIGGFHSVAQYYIGNLLPVALKLPGVKAMDPSTIIVSKNPSEPHLPHVDIDREMVYYNSNSGLDLDKDGSITYGDIENFLNKKRGELQYKNAIAQLSNIDPKKKDMIQPNDFVNKLNGFLDTLIASPNKQTNDYTVSIIGPNLESSVEFSRVLALSFREGLSIKATSHQNNNKIEVMCSVKGPEEFGLKIVNAFTQHISEEFYKQTKKIGGIKIATLVRNKKSDYEYLDIKTASMCYRKFISKFV